MFLHCLKEMQAGDLTLKIEPISVGHGSGALDGYAHKLTCRQAAYEMELALPDPNEFPEITADAGEDSETITLKGADLHEAVHKVLYAVSKDETRWVLTGVFLAGRDGQLSVAGTDGNRLALARKTVGDEFSMPGVVVPENTIKLVLSMIPEVEDVEIVLEEKKVQFRTANVTLISRTIQGKYPDYMDVLARHENVININRARLRDALGRVSAISALREPVKIEFHGGKELTLTVITEMARASETIQATYAGMPADFAINTKFLIDIVAHLKAENIDLQVPSAYGSILCEEGEDVHMAMPLREH
jgi:DNA polymerase-3 subunit beta